MSAPTPRVRTATALITSGVVLAALGLAPSHTSAQACSGTVSEPAKTLPRMFPPLVRGDADFAAHGPSITVSAKRKHISVVGGPSASDSLIVLVTMRAEETRSDWTRAFGARTYTLYTAPPGCAIEFGSVQFGPFDSNGYLNRSAGVRRLPPGDADTLNRTFVSGYTVYDDRSGNDVGSYTSVRVKVRAFTLRLTP